MNDQMTIDQDLEPNAEEVVDYATAKEELKAEAPAKETAEEDPKEIIDAIVPRVDPVTRKLSDGKIEREYVQRPLSYFGKMEFFAEIGDAIDMAMSSENALTVNAMMNTVNASGIAGGPTDLDSFVAGITKLLRYAPNLLLNSYCIWLGIPHDERPWARAAMVHPVHGLDDEMGLDVLEVFIDQNIDEVRSFFVERARALVERARKSWDAAAAGSQR